MFPAGSSVEHRNGSVGDPFPGEFNGTSSGAAGTAFYTAEYWRLAGNKNYCITMYVITNCLLYMVLSEMARSKNYSVLSCSIVALNTNVY